MSKYTLEIMFDNHDLMETFRSWMEEDGFDVFQDWVLNYCDNFDELCAIFEDSVIVVEE